MIAGDKLRAALTQIEELSPYADPDLGDRHLLVPQKEVLDILRKAVAEHDEQEMLADEWKRAYFVLADIVLKQMGEERL